MESINHPLIGVFALTLVQDLTFDLAEFQEVHMVPLLKPYKFCGDDLPHSLVPSSNI